MTVFNKRIDHLKAMLPAPPQKMTFIYADGEQVEVVGFLAATRQNRRRDGLIDVLGANEGLKEFLLCSQCDVKKLFSEEGAEHERTGEQLPPAAETAPGPEGDQRPDAGGAVWPVKEQRGPVRKRRVFPLPRRRRRNR